jgi:hypothetical protein
LRDGHWNDKEKDRHEPHNPSPALLLTMIAGLSNFGVDIVC